MVDDPKDPRNRAAPITPTYDAAARGVEKQPAAEQKASDMVKQDQPKLVPTPSGPMREGPDRQSYNARLSGEVTKNKPKMDPEKVAELAKSIQARKDMEKSKDKDHDK